jgi:two-component sensor histidine kinase
MAGMRRRDLLLQTNWTSAALGDIVKAAIAPFDQAGSGFLVQSSDIEVSPGAALQLAMVLNELSTNAVKYGALSNPTGRVQITALVDDARGQFRLKWAESGGPPVRPPSHRVKTDRTLLCHSAPRHS